MSEIQKYQFSGPVTIFQERRLPEQGKLAGYSALIEAYDLKVPLPYTLCAVGMHHKMVEQDGWRLFTPRHAPTPTLEGHLTFALKYEGVNLGGLKQLFKTVAPVDIEAIVKAQPTGRYMRRVWFLYEWLMAKELNIPDVTTGRYVVALDPKQQWCVEGVNSRRHRVIDNLPGTPEFCPLVFRSQTLDDYASLNLAQRARDSIAKVPRDLLARTAAFLLLKDSRSSYAIEGEHPPQDRIQRWGRAIGEAGQHPLDMDELLRLQKLVIGDARFVKLGLRDEGGFVGEHDRDTQMPLPAHISAKADDLASLLQGIMDFAGGASKGLDPVIAAAIMAFGFVYIHPFEDGNGRIHRYLIHHILAEFGFNPVGLVFPVSAAILENIEDYRHVLEIYSNQLLPLIDWQATAKGNIEVLNDTADFYRYFDATPHAEFLYACVQRTIEQDLPNETQFLQKYDQFKRHVLTLVDMPDRLLDILFRFLQQNQGKLSKRALDNEFKMLTADEVKEIESFYHSLSFQ